MTPLNLTRFELSEPHMWTPFTLRLYAAYLSGILRAATLSEAIDAPPRGSVGDRGQYLRPLRGRELRPFGEDKEDRTQAGEDSQDGEAGAIASRAVGEHAGD